MKILHHNTILRCFAILLAVLLCCSGSVFAVERESLSDVRIIFLHGEINAAQRRYFESELRTAEEEGSALLVDIDTESGLIGEAVRIKDSILNADVPVCAYVSGQAVSAGMLIALACDEIYLSETAVIGNAEPDLFRYAGTLEEWEAVIRDTAARTGRDQTLFAAMADRAEVIEGVVSGEDILSLTGAQAVEYGAADGVAKDAGRAAKRIWPALNARTVSPTFGVYLSRFLGSTAVSALLFTVGLMCLYLQLMTPGFSLFGVISLGCFLLYFGGSFLAGYSQWWTIVLFAVGAALLLVEVVVPGFGVLGISGIVCIALSVFFSSRNAGQFFIALAIALGCCAVILPIVSKLVLKSTSFQKIVLEDSVIDETAPERPTRIGREGVALTVLRPSGKAMVDGEKLDVQCDCGYIPAGTAVVIVYEDGSKIVVAPKENA